MRPAARRYVDGDGCVPRRRSLGGHHGLSCAGRLAALVTPGLHARQPQAEGVDVRARPLDTAFGRRLGKARGWGTQWVAAAPRKKYAPTRRRAASRRARPNTKCASRAGDTRWNGASRNRSARPVPVTVKWPMGSAGFTWSGRRRRRTQGPACCPAAHAPLPSGIRTITFTQSATGTYARGARCQALEELLPRPRHVWQPCTTTVTRGRVVAVRGSGVRWNPSSAVCDRVHCRQRWRTVVAAATHTRPWLGVVVRYPHAAEMVPLHLELPDRSPNGAARAGIEDINMVRVTGVGLDRPEGHDNHVHCYALQVRVPRGLGGGRERRVRRGWLALAPVEATHLHAFPRAIGWGSGACGRGLGGGRAAARSASIAQLRAAASTPSPVLLTAVAAAGVVAATLGVVGAPAAIRRPLPPPRDGSRLRGRVGGSGHDRPPRQLAARGAVLGPPRMQSPLDAGQGR